MSDYRFGVEDYRLNYRPHEVMDKDGYIDWEKVEAVEIDRVDFIRKPDDKSQWFEMFGTLTADDIRDLIERHSDESVGNGRDFHNGAYEAIADELNAKLGEPKRAVCSECGILLSDYILCTPCAEKLAVKR